MGNKDFNDLWNRGILTSYSNDLQSIFEYKARRQALIIVMVSERRHLYLPFKQGSRYNVTIYN